MSKSMLLKPRVSEKSYGLSEVSRTYVFEVPMDANKLTVSEAVAAQFEVAVIKVNIQRTKGKSMRFIRKGGKVDNGSRVTVKRAYVTLKDGDSIPIFAALEEDSKEDKKSTDAKDSKTDSEKAPRKGARQKPETTVKAGEEAPKRRPTLRFRRSGSK